MALSQKKMRIRSFMRFLGIVLTVVFFLVAYWYISNRPPLILQKGIKRQTDIAPKFLGNILGGLNGTLSKPLDIAVNAQGKIYITDSNNDRIQVFSPTGSPLFNFGTTGKGKGNFTFPNCIAIDDENNIYVGEFKINRIQVFNSSGKYIRTINSPKEILLEPLAITFGNDKRLYVASRNGVIIVMDKAGQLLAKFGTNGTRDGQLSYPNGIAVDRHGNILVSDSGNDRIQVFDQNGKVLRVFGKPDFKVAVPRGIAIDNKDRIYVVDIFGHKVVVYDKEFKYLFEFGSRGLENGQFNFPNGVEADENKVYVTDRENNRVQAYNY